jgi:hypothetical protein
VQVFTVDTLIGKRASLRGQRAVATVSEKVKEVAFKLQYIDDTGVYDMSSVPVLFEDLHTF